MGGGAPPISVPHTTKHGVRDLYVRERGEEGKRTTLAARTSQVRVIANTAPRPNTASCRTGACSSVDAPTSNPITTPVLLLAGHRKGRLMPPASSLTKDAQSWAAWRRVTREHVAAARHLHCGENNHGFTTSERASAAAAASSAAAAVTAAAAAVAAACRPSPASSAVAA